MNSAGAPRPAFVLTGRHVLIGFVLFFAADIAINAAFMVSAYRTFPGETSVTPYEDGLAYNAALAQQRAQAARGWRLTAEVSSGHRIRVEAFDRAGDPLRGLHLVARLQRPATQSGARIVTFNEAAPGAYLASAEGLSDAWDLDITARDSAGEKMVATRRLTFR